MIGFSIACKQDGGVFNCGVLADGVAAQRALYQSATDLVFDIDGANVLTGRLDFDAPAATNMRLTTQVDGVSGGAPVDGVPRLRAPGARGAVDSRVQPSAARRGHGMTVGLAE